MIVLYPLVILGAVALVLRRRGEVVGGRGWSWFGAWCAAGMLFTFSFASGFSIGLFVLPLAAGALLYVAWRAPHLSEGLGFVAGLGAMLLVVALLNHDYRPCPEEGLSLPAGGSATSFECGGADPTPWLVAGVVIVAIPLLGYGLSAVSRGTRPRPGPGRSPLTSRRGR